MVHLSPTSFLVNSSPSWREGPAPTTLAHLEVGRVHLQLVRVQVAQSRQGTGQVVQVVHGQGQRVSHLLAVGFDLGGAGAQVQVGEVCLGGGEGQEGPLGGMASEVRPWSRGLGRRASGGQGSIPWASRKAGEPGGR